MPKKTITLTIDSELWARCQELRETSGANWSQIAEEVFRKIVRLVDDLSQINSGGGPQEIVEKDVQLRMHQAYYQAVSDTCAAMEQVMSGNAESGSESR